MKEFDENEAVEMMKAALPEEDRNRYDEDQLINLIDIIWDYYEQNGLLEIDLSESDDEDEEILLDDIVDYAARMIKKDKNATIAVEHIPLLVEAEIKYEDSILAND